MTQSFPKWFKQQATRQDAIGELARKYPKVRSWDDLTDNLEFPNGQQINPHREFMDDLRTAYQAREEWEKL